MEGEVSQEKIKKQLKGTASHKTTLNSSPRLLMEQWGLNKSFQKEEI